MATGHRRKRRKSWVRLRRRARRAATQAKSKLREQLDQRSSQAAEQINQQASDLRAVSESLREQGKDGPANAAGKLAESTEKIAGYLRDKDSDALLADVEDFARRQPWAVGAGAMALGFVVSRLLKASSSKRYSARYGQSGVPEIETTPAALTPPLSEPTTVAGEVSSPVIGAPEAASASPMGASPEALGSPLGAPSAEGMPGA